MELLPDDFRILRYHDGPSYQGHEVPIRLKATTTWSHCGPVLDPSRLPNSFHQWSKAAFDGDLVPYLLPFLSFVHRLLEQENLNHYWLTVRATTATQDFDQPRWHTDMPTFGRSNSKGGDWKLCATLLGPGTIILADGAKGRTAQKDAWLSARKRLGLEHECTTMRCLGCSNALDEVRQHLAEELKTVEAVQVARGECVLMRVGDETGSIHSEPPSHGDRIFVSVLPGSRDELKNLTERWGMEFPRSWSLGVMLDYEG